MASERLGFTIMGTSSTALGGERKVDSWGVSRKNLEWSRIRRIPTSFLLNTNFDENRFCLSLLLCDPRERLPRTVQPFHDCTIMW